MKRKNTLKTCPWCGQYPEIKRHKDGWLISCENMDCLVQPFVCFKSKHNALFAWNDRAAIRESIADGTCQNIGDDENTENEFICSVCGNHITDCEGYYVHGTWNYCSKCGRKVVSK